MRQMIKSEKKNKFDFVKFVWNNSGSSENSKIAILNKENTILIYDFRNLNAPLSTITPKQNSSQEICGLSWDKSDSILFVVGGE
jgi:WD40 repeat protein